MIDRTQALPMTKSKTFHLMPAVSALASMLVAACTATSQHSQANGQVHETMRSHSSADGGRTPHRGIQTIVKMNDLSLDPSQPEVLERIAKVARSTVTYVRPMSGQSHVIIILPTSLTTYQEALQRMRESGLVEYVEPDTVAKMLPKR